MELNLQEVTSPIRPASTVMLLRDASDGVEVFLLKRHGLSDVLAGAFVFPGGKVDPTDGDLSIERHLDRQEHELALSLGEPEPSNLSALSLYVGAMREVFEECGVLFAEGATAQDAERGQSLLREGHAFDEMLALLSLRLQTRCLLPWSRWITPKVPTVTNKRFDTRFFVSALPQHQAATHDNREATDSAWMTPYRALRSYWDGEIDFAPPQIMSLAQLSHFPSVQAVLDFARTHPPPLIAPEPVVVDGLRTVCYPGDVRHPVQQRALPGPTRLVFRNKRFEPPDGFESLFQD
jgi:8-oxo-dGTP pyrophosphatase MutT (NUDIX family)